MFDRIGWGTNRDWLLFYPDRAAINLMDAKDALDHLGAPGTHQAGQPQNFTAAQIKANIVDDPFAAQVAHG